MRFAFRRGRKTLYGGHDPREAQRRSVEARKRNKAQRSQDLASRLEKVALELLANPETPAYLKVKLLARLGKAAPAPLDIGSGENPGVSLSSLLEQDEQHDQGETSSASSGRAERGGEAGVPSDSSDALSGGLRPRNLSDAGGTPTPSDFSTAEEFDLLGTMGDPVKWLRTASEIQTRKERARPDPGARPWEQFSDDYWR